MKKTLAILLALLMVVTLFACTKEEAPVTTPEVPATEEPTLEGPENPVDGVFDFASATLVTESWPAPAASYDPALDGQGIPSGAEVYGLFDALNYTPIDAPAEIGGLTKVDAITDLADGSWYLLAASSGFNYVILGTANLGEVPEGPATADPVAPVLPTGALGITATGIQDKFYLFDLASAGFGTGLVYALYFDEGGTVTFDTDVVVTGFDAALTATTTNIAAGTATLVKDINEQSITLSDGSNSVCFVSAPNAVNYAALVPDQSIDALPASIALTK